MCQGGFYPEVRGMPLVLGDDAKSPSAEADILAQELNKLHSSNQTATTVQNSWYCTITTGESINNAWQNKAHNEVGWF